MAAEKLNNKAAEEIFRLRNSNNDIWKIDMHGLLEIDNSCLFSVGLLVSFSWQITPFLVLRLSSPHTDKHCV